MFDEYCHLDVDEQCYQYGYSQALDDAASEGSDHVADIADAAAAGSAAIAEEVYADQERDFVRAAFVRGYIDGYTLA